MDKAICNNKSNFKESKPCYGQVSAYIEDSVLGFWCQNQVESTIVGEVPVINQQDLILWVALSDKGIWNSSHSDGTSLEIMNVV